jgi:hypothetical protein
MTKKAIIFHMTADNDITCDLGWDPVNLSVAWDPVADEWLFADFDAGRIRDWLDIRGYTEIPVNDVFTSESGDWEMKE